MKRRSYVLVQGDETADASRIWLAIYDSGAFDLANGGTIAAGARAIAIRRQVALGDVGDTIAFLQDAFNKAERS